MNDDNDVPMGGTEQPQHPGAQPQTGTQPQYPGTQPQYGGQPQHPDAAPYPPQPGVAPYPQHPDAAPYPPLPGAAPQPAAAPYPAAASAGAALQPEAPAKKRSRKPLILLAAIGSPVVVLGVLAALIVPGIVRNAQAEAAAAEFRDQHAAWQEVYGSEEFAALADLDPDEFGEIYTALRADSTFWTTTAEVAEATGFVELCATYDSAIDTLTSAASVPVPTRPEVDGGAGNEAYDAAIAEWDSHADAYAAAEELAGQADSVTDSIRTTCEYVIAENELDRTVVADFRDFAKLRTLKFEEQERIRDWPEENVALMQTCQEEAGCVTFKDLEVRAQAGDLWDTAILGMHDGMAELLLNSCPARMADGCALRAEAEKKLSTLAAAIGEAYRTEDPTALSNEQWGIGIDNIPMFRSANDAYVLAQGAGEDRVYTPFDEYLQAEFETIDQDQAMAIVVADAVKTLRTAAMTITG